MRLLLDSHALLWMLTDAKRLAETARSALVEAGGGNVFYSPLSLYELMFKAHRGRVPAAALELPGAIEDAGLAELPPTARHFVRAAAIEWRHGDPWDRILLAQALLEDMHLVSADRLFDEVTERRIW